MSGYQRYQQIIDVTEDYFGLAARRLIDHVLSGHLHKQPKDITDGDIETIALWARLAAGHITDNRDEIEKFSERLVQLKRKRG